jgi:hypothetical protein
MTADSQYSDSARVYNAEQTGTFKDSQEASFRRIIRQTIRKGPFTKSEREVVLAFINHWFQHRKSTKGVVHPGRKKLAKRAGVSIRTVASVLDLLRTHGVIDAKAHLHGLHGNATEYTVCTVALTELCAKKKADIRVDGVQNCTGTGRAKIAHRINNVIAFPSQDVKASKGAA